MPVDVFVADEDVPRMVGFEPCQAFCVGAWACFLLGRMISESAQEEKRGNDISDEEESEMNVVVCLKHISGAEQK